MCILKDLEINIIREENAGLCVLGADTWTNVVPREGNGALKRKSGSKLPHSKKNREMTDNHHNRASEISQMEFGSGSVSDMAGNYPEKWATSSKGTSRESARFHLSGKRVNRALRTSKICCATEFRSPCSASAGP